MSNYFLSASFMDKPIDIFNANKITNTTIINDEDFIDG